MVGIDMEATFVGREVRTQTKQNYAYWIILSISGFGTFQGLSSRVY